MKKDKKPVGHVITKVLSGGIGEEMGLEPGDIILSIDGTEIEDIFDYQFLVQDDYIEVEVLTKDGEECTLEIDKDFDEDLGIEFENGLMSEYRSCCNKCMFCFIDQMPKGMRETLYFKDDDSRLSFLQGNYVTLTNMSDHDIDRIIRYRLSPINISFHTMNPELRVKMLHNRFAGEALKKVYTLRDADITMNGQIVLCPGINDGDELEYSLTKLEELMPQLQSVSVVPVGLTKFREGLYPLRTFTPEESGQVIDTIERWQKKIYEKTGSHFVHASDEWYIVAGRELPEADRYDGYLQIENGVGMIRSMLDEFHERLEILKKEPVEKRETMTGTFTYITGTLIPGIMEKVAAEIMEVLPGVKLQVLAVVNDFFGPHITVSGLLTGQDIIAQCKGKNLGKAVFLPENVLRAGDDVFLDDYHLPEVEKALQVPIDIVKSSGYELIDCVLRNL